MSLVLLLYYQKFCRSLTNIGFKTNPNNPCVANKIIKGKQRTIAFHVGGSKLSHNNPKEIDNMIKCWLREEYESIFENRSG